MRAVSRGGEWRGRTWRREPNADRRLIRAPFFRGVEARVGEVSIKSRRNVPEKTKRLDFRARVCAHRHARRTHDTDTTRTSPSTMTSNATTDDDTRVDTAAAQGGFSSLFLAAISTTHILRSDFLPEPGDLGRVRAVSHGMRDAVDATGREIKKLSDDEALDLGYVSLLKDRHSRGLLSAYRYHFPCAAAARNGDLQELKALRADELPWDAWTCAYAAEGGHLGILQWARENGCPWNDQTCTNAAKHGHLEVLKWARENGCPWDEDGSRIAAMRGYVES